MKIFLSYGHDNAAEALVLRIKTDLAHLGHEVWLDRERIEFGDDWRREVTEGIIESDQVLAFLSEHSTRDPGVCRDEIAIALGAGKAYVFTILVQPEVDVSLPISVSHLQWLDMHDWQARQQADTDAFEVWYAERFAQICAVIDHPDNQRFAGEISQLEEYLLPLDCTPDINSRLPGFTGRQWLLDEINTWREGDRSSRIFCLSGGPGMGKSAVVAWLAHSNKAQVIAAQFCRYNSPERRDPTRVIRSIAFQLATRLPDYRRHLLNQPEIKDLDRKNPVDLFDYLLANPLRYAINGNRPRQLIVIDALDETLQNGQSVLTELIASQLSKLPDWLGWVVTSRPESAIRGQLEQFGLHEINADDPRNQDDVETYIQHWLPTLGLEDAELLQAQQQILTAAQGNFLYVRQLQAAIQQNIIDIKQLNDLPKGLSALYLREFNYRYPDTHHYEQELLPVLEILVASSRPIPTSDIETLLNYSKRQRAKVLERLGSYLTVTEQGVALFHKSLQDWLLDERSAGADYFVEVDNGHQALGKVLWKQFTQTEDLVSCLDSFMALELPEQLRYWSDEELVSLIGIGTESLYYGSINKFIEIEELEFSLRDIQVAWGWLGLRLSQICNGLMHPQSWNQLTYLGLLLQYLDDYAKAEQLFRKALAIVEDNLASNHYLGQSLNNLANLFSDQGDYAGAETFYERALVIVEQKSGLNHPDTASLLNNLGSLLNHQGNYKKAEPLIRRALVISEENFGIDHPDTVYALNNLGLLLKHQGNYEKAEAIFRRVLAISEKNFGVNHPTLGNFLNNLAILQDDQGDYNAAEIFYRRALAISEQNFGSNHRRTLIALNNLNTCLQYQENYEESEPLRRALAITEKTLGINHPETLNALSNLGRLLNTQGNYEEAELIHRRELDIAESFYDVNNPNVMIGLSNLAVSLENRGDFIGAEPLYRRALKIAEYNNDVDTKTILNKLAEILYYNGSYIEAKNIYLQALEIDEDIGGFSRIIILSLIPQLKELGHYEDAKTLYLSVIRNYRKKLSATEHKFGANHHKTKRCLNELAEILRDNGDYARAEKLYQKSLENSENFYGINHLECLKNLNDLASLFEKNGDYTKAESFYLRGLEIVKQNYGTDHIKYVDGLNKLALLFKNHSENVKAEFFYRKSLDIMESISHIHPKTASILEGLACVLEINGSYDEAVKLYRRAWLIYIDVFGEDHSETIFIQKRYDNLMAIKI